MRTLLFGLLVCLIAGCRLPTGPGTRVVESSPHVLVSQTAPQEGLRRTDKFLAIENQPGELIWLTGCSVQTQAEESVARPVLSRCSLVLKNALRHNDLHGLKQNPQGVLFRFSPGAEKVELPVGFGIPINSNEPLLFGTESQSPDAPTEPVEVSFRLSLDYIRQRGLTEQLNPLYCVQLSSLVSTGEKPLYYGLPNPDPEKHGPGAGPERPATSNFLKDGHEQAFADSWYLKPGAHTYHTYSSRILALQRDTKLHLATGHMSRFGTALELYDLTEKKAVLRLEQTPDGSAMQQYSSSQGLELFADHDYELIGYFDNTSQREAKVSAQMMLYFETPEFEYPNTL